MDRFVAGDYRIVKPLSEGGMGSVFVAEQMSTGKRRALKLMKPELARDPRFRERFILEAKAGSRIDSEHVVEVVGAGIDEPSGSPWLAMELLDGEDLATRISARGALPFSEVTEALRQMGHALTKAHEAGIVHRDLKPENIFVARARRDGVPFTLKILDFGIAKLVSDATNATSGAATGALGTPLWMSPEQADARGVIGPAADIWPLGLIVYFALTGRYYWRSAEANASVTALLKEMLFEALEPPTVRCAAHGLPPSALPIAFDAWFFRCVARDPRARFPSVREAIDVFASLRSQGFGAALAATAPQLPSAPPPSPFALTQAAPLQVYSTTPPRIHGRRESRYWLIAIPVVVLLLVPLALFLPVKAYLSRPHQAKPSKAEVAEAKRVEELLPETSGFVDAEDAAIPIYRDDPAAGTKTPLVVATLFCGWKDVECERLARAADTAMKEPGAHVRVVYKHAVPRNDSEGQLAAQTAQGIFESVGLAGFLKFRDAVFAHRGEITRTNVLAWAREAGVLDAAELGRRLDERRWASHVDRDGDLAARLRISQSTMLANCSEAGSDFALRLASAPGRSELLRLADSETTKDMGAVVRFWGFSPYKQQCAEKVKEKPITINPPSLRRSPFASDGSEDGARDTVLRFMVASSQYDKATLSALVADSIRVGGKGVSRAAFVSERTAKKGQSPVAVVDMNLEPEPKDPAVRYVKVAAVTRAERGNPQFLRQRFRVTRSDAGWRVDEEDDRIAFAPKTCEEHSVIDMLTAPAVADLLLEAPTQAEKEEGCISRAAEIGVCNASYHCSLHVVCYRGTSVKTLRYFELEPRSGTLRSGISSSDPLSPVPFPRAGEVQVACAAAGDAGP